MICKNCGRELSETTVFCGGCGTKVEQMNEEAVEKEETAEKEEAVEAVEEIAGEKTEEQVQTASGCACESENCPFCASGEDMKASKHGFGIGAVVFCLTLVFVASVACGVFAGLYFSERDNNSRSVSAEVMS